MGAILALACLPSGARGDRVSRVTVSDQPAHRVGARVAVRPIARDFVGVSIDWCAVGLYTRDRGIAVLAHLLKGLDPSRPDIRIGGDGTDDRCHGHHARGPTRREANSVASLARAVHARLILGINLKSHSRALARSQARILRRALDHDHVRSDLDAVEIGNEPDRYRAYGNGLPQPQIGPYFHRFLHDFAAWAGVARTVFGDPTLPIAGPSLGRYGLPWLAGADRTNFARFVFGPGHPQLITFHSYPLLGSAKCPSRLCGSLPDLLLESATAGLAQRVAHFVGLAGRRPVRVDEMNSITSGGRAGASDTFGSALWAADALFAMARAGVRGVNLHTFSAARYALFSRLPHGIWLVHPDYYGLLLFARAAPAGSQLLRVTPQLVGPAGGPGVKVWATRGRDGATRIALINKAAVARTMLLRGPGVPAAATVSVQLLRAPTPPYAAACSGRDASSDLCATRAVSFGGRTFGAPAPGALGGDRTTTGTLEPVAPGTCASLTRCVPRHGHRPQRAITVRLAGGTAALLTGLTPPRRRHKR